MSKLREEMPSVKKLQDDIKVMKLFSFLGGKETRQKFKELDEQFHALLLQTEKFNEYFSDKGWIAYDSMNSTIIQKAVKTYSENGIDAAEGVLIAYYSDERNNHLYQIKNGSKEFSMRFHLIEKAFADHYAGRYYASIPLFLMIIDGAVNDYTKSQGFFAEGTDVDVWDCLVGCSDGLQKLKSIYCKGRNKTNIEPIYFPYRNGILHGRDLNYDNAYVSCKCIVLLFAIHNWIKNKRSEEDRKQKFNTSKITPSWSELFKNIQINNYNKKRISEWKTREIIVGKDVPETGEFDEYAEFDYIQKIVEMCESWKAKNYGKLSVLLKNLFRYGQSEKLRPKECRELFQNKEFIGFRILEIEDRAMALKRILVEAKWKTNEKIFTEELEFGVVYQGADEKTLIPYDDAGEWVIMPWNVKGLYKF